jgi:GH43 family beta-xylosidase
MNRFINLSRLAVWFAAFGAAAAVAEPVTTDEFQPIFNGKNLDGWLGDAAYWRVEDGALVGEITPDKLLKQNSWIVWQGGEVSDFELRGEYWVSAAGNSGIGYRCEPLPGIAHAVRGSQFDIEGGDRWTGQNYEERGRTFLAYRGQSVTLDPGCKPRITGVLGDPLVLQRECVRKEEWNAVRIVARGPLMRHYLNDRLVSEVWDNDPVARRLSGKIGVRVHVGPPMVIKFRNLRIKSLPPAPTFRNPLGPPPLAVPDPHVIRHNGRYYLYGTTDPNKGFRVHSSTDLVNWKLCGWAWQDDSNNWAEPPFWAPEVFEYKGRFYFTYSGRVKGSNPAKLWMVLAVADRPEGPFADLHAPWFDPGYSTIDGHLLVHTDGVPYLIFSRNGARDGYAFGQLYAAPVKPDFSGLAAEPKLILEADQPWERVRWATNRCNEGACVLRYGGRYVMTYSANSTFEAFYGVGVATADHPLGPWTKDPANPLVTSDLARGISSPGHNGLAWSPDGRELFLIYHSHLDPKNPMSQRVVNLDRLYFNPAGKLQIIGPTRDPQFLPAGAWEN